MTISFVIPDDKVSRLVNAVNAEHPVPVNSDGTPEFLPAQWAKEYFRRLMIRTVFAYERRQKEAEVIMDDTIAG